LALRLYIDLSTSALGSAVPLGTLRLYLPDAEIDFIEVAPANGRAMRSNF
jgi:hypothetical protein